MVQSVRDVKWNLWKAPADDVMRFRISLDRIKKRVLQQVFSNKREQASRKCTREGLNLDRSIGSPGTCGNFSDAAVLRVTGTMYSRREVHGASFNEKISM
jgi:hypothetical protein